jgi:hypothetical protein
MEVQKTREMSKPAKMHDECFEAHKLLRWPRFDLEPTKATFKMPCGVTCQRIFHEACGKIEDHLLCNLSSWKTGKSLRWDGMFAIVAKMMDSPTAEATKDALVKILGEHGCLLTWAFTQAEDDAVVKHLLCFLKMQAFCLGGQPAVDEVIAAHTDACCQEGLLLPETHFFTSIFQIASKPPAPSVHAAGNVKACTFNFLLI